MVTEVVSYSRRITLLADKHPDKTAVIFIPREGEERSITWRELDAVTSRFARYLQDAGIDQNSMIVVGLPNSPEHIFATVAAWKLGALVLSLRWEMPERERDELLALAKPDLVVAAWPGIDWPLLQPDIFAALSAYSADPLPDIIAHPAKAIASGGSTGRPKIIIEPAAMAFVPDNETFNVIGLRARQTQLVAAPLYHNAPFGVCYFGLFEDHTLIVMEKFDAAQAVDLIERFRVSYIYMAPTLMQRIARLPGITERDFSSIESLYHTAAPCPAWLKQAWIDLIGGEHLYEVFGTTENFGATVIRGDEWLAHPGSVGRPMVDSELKILDAEMQELPAGEIGEIYMRKPGNPVSYQYVGSAPAKATPAGFITVGDLGYVDEQGYLYIADRRVDMIISGGANVYPAEVEAALSEHPDVADVVVIGLPDDEWGKRVHALIQPTDYATLPTVSALDHHCRQRLMAYKVPKTYEFVEQLPRQLSGKIRRTALVQARESGWTDAMISVKAAH